MDSNLICISIIQEDRLMVSDPLALKYILNSQLFAFGPSHAKVVNVLLGHGNMLLKHGTYCPYA